MAKADVWPSLIPELQVSDLARSIAFYRDVGFEVAYNREEEEFAMLRRGRAALMLETVGGPGRRFGPRELTNPFGRGVSFQIEDEDVDTLYCHVQARGYEIIVELEQRWYRAGTDEAGNEQFVVSDPDGYLLRFFGDLGSRARTRQLPEQSF
jgi:catechol 2,3-dioxygenase-like lactoylglutathione lyase family enzyme